MEVKIAPSLLSCDFAQLESEIRSVEQGGADILHLDVMDGHFVPNITFGPLIVEAVRRLTTLPLDVHLMISEPKRYLKSFVSAGADWVSFHVEADDDPYEVIELGKSMGIKLGVVCNPPTSIEDVFPFIRDVDFVLVMTVNPGFGGQRFIPDAASKIQVLRECYPELEIEVDGGINEETAHEVRMLGANILVSGSYIFSSRNRAESIIRLRG